MTKEQLEHGFFDSHTVKENSNTNDSNPMAIFDIIKKVAMGAI